MEYVAEMPETLNPEEKWQLVYNRHQDLKKKLKKRGIRPFTIVVTKGIADCKRVTDELQDFLVDWEKITAEQARDKVLAVTSAKEHQPNVAKLKLADSPASKLEWIVSVSMLSEGWDVKNVFQIVPHEERAFNSKLLIAQVLGRGLRWPEGWQGEDPVVTVFNHDAWSGRIKHLVNEILEIERRVTSTVNPVSPYNFELYHLNYDRLEDTSEYTKKGEYRLLEQGYVDLPTQVEVEDVTVEYERAVTGEHTKFRTEIQHKTWSVEEVAEAMFNRLKWIDEESREAEDPKDRTNYAKKFPLQKCEQIVRKSLILAKNTSGCIMDGNRQKFLQALGTLRRKRTKRVIYKLSAKALDALNTSQRQAESCSAAELRRGSKTVFYGPGCEATLQDEQKEFFREVVDPDGEFAGARVPVVRSSDYRVPACLTIADGGPERKFIRELCSRDNAKELDAWLKNTPVGFYFIEYAWKKGEHPKRGTFSPDFFLKQGAHIFVIEIKGDEEIKDPSSENLKKHEYASAHFERLNSWLEKEKIIARYQFNMLTPQDYGKFFTKLRSRELIGFRSELDVVLAKSAKATSQADM
ncbi:MAG: hypothetical protein KUA32_00560 [Candidatus Desulforudis sp.]|nr:hypothetical protein [Desulforudis sp.]